MKFDKLEWQRNRRANNDNSWTRKYEKTKKGFLVRMYRNMKSRTCGIQKKKSHLYLGLSLVEKELFYDWALNSELFHSMFLEWETANYSRKLTPTVDRVDSSIGYELNNMQWLTHSDNSKKGCESRYSKVK
jgi:hypothetical protein